MKYNFLSPTITSLFFVRSKESDDLDHSDTENSSDGNGRGDDADISGNFDDDDDEEDDDEEDKAERGKKYEMDSTSAGPYDSESDSSDDDSEVFMYSFCRFNDFALCRFDFFLLLFRILPFNSSRFFSCRKLSCAVFLLYFDNTVPFYLYAVLFLGYLLSSLSGIFRRLFWYVIGRLGGQVIDGEYH